MIDIRGWIIVPALVASAAGAQQRPDFTGEWTSAEDRTQTVAATGDAGFRRGDMGSGWAATIRIAQRADSMIVEYVFFAPYDLQPPVRLAFRMDGNESRQSIMIGHASAERRSRVRWQGDTLVITTLHAAPGPNGRPVDAEVRQALTLESPTSLVLETTRVGVLGGSTTRSRTGYTRK
jgi:hypothetical protein